MRAGGGYETLEFRAFAHARGAHRVLAPPLGAVRATRPDVGCHALLKSTWVVGWRNLSLEILVPICRYVAVMSAIENRSFPAHAESLGAGDVGKLILPSYL